MGGTGKPHDKSSIVQIFINFLLLPTRIHFVDIAKQAT